MSATFLYYFYGRLYRLSDFVLLKQHEYLLLVYNTYVYIIETT